MQQFLPQGCQLPSMLVCVWYKVLRQFGDRRDQAGAAATSAFADALYTAQLRLFLLAKMSNTGVDQDLPSMLAELRQGRPTRTSAPSKQLMDSITYSARLHSTIAWLATQLSSDEAQQQLQHALILSDNANRLRQQLQSVFAEPSHQRLLMSYLLHNCADDLSEVLEGQICTEGLGTWTTAWANAMRYVTFTSTQCASDCHAWPHDCGWH